MLEIVQMWKSCEVTIQVCTHLRMTKHCNYLYLVFLYKTCISQVRYTRPLPLKQKPSTGSFESNLKTFLFPKQYTCRVFHSVLLSSSTLSLFVVCLNCVQIKFCMVSILMCAGACVCTCASVCMCMCVCVLEQSLQTRFCTLQILSLSL